jgi:hypothetical protein
MNKIFRHKHEIIQWLDKMNINLYTIEENKDPDSDFKFVVSVRNNVYLVNKNLTHFPIQFGVIEGTFNCSQNKLTSLEGAPFNVRDDFICSNNQLTSLKYCPKKIRGSLNATHNELTSLEHCPSIMGNYQFEYNKITSLLGLPEYIYDSLYVSFNQLKNLEHSPKKIYGSVIFSSNPITSLAGTDLEVEKSVSLLKNDLTTILYEDLEHFKAKSIALDIKLFTHLKLTPRNQNEEFGIIDVKPLKEHLKIDYEKRMLEKKLPDLNLTQSTKIKL